MTDQRAEQGGSDSRVLLDVIVLKVPHDRYVGFRMKLLDLLDEYGVEKLADQSSGDNVGVAEALAVLARAVDR